MADGLLQNVGATTPTDPTNISETAQDVAKAQGVAYSDIGKTQVDMPDSTYNATGVNESIGQNVDIKSGLSYLNEDKSTVAGQLKSLLATDSPYIQEARQQGKEQAASRGLLNSSISAGASQREAIKAALPIASQDAETSAKFQAAQQATEYQQENVKQEAIVSSELAKQNAQIKQSQQNIQNAFSAQLQGASEQSKIWIQDLQNTYTAGQEELNRQQNQLLQQEDTSARKMETIRTQSSNIMQNYQISVENLMTDPDFLNLGAAAVQNTISQMQTLASNSINFLGASSGVDMTPFVDAFLEPITIET